MTLHTDPRREDAGPTPARAPDLGEGPGRAAPRPPSCQRLLEEAVQYQLLTPAQVRAFLATAGEPRDAAAVGDALVAAGLLTRYQVTQLLFGRAYHLRMGNYRLLEPVGDGSVGKVFVGEHTLLLRKAAIKVLPVDEDFPADVLERFHAEMRVLAQLNHPNIVAAYDAGVVPPPYPRLPTIHYLVMELVAGGDLEDYVYRRQAPLPVEQACELVRQAACGLQAAHDHHLIHRDLKPSNMLLTEQGQVKLVDFGLARQFCSTLTDPSALLGSLEFMAPEQSLDPTAVGVPADIYGLGATLFWLLTGQTPYPQTKRLSEALRALQNDPPRRARDFRPDIPEELDALIARMLSRDPRQRPAMPIMVMDALERFAAPAAGAPPAAAPEPPAAAGAAPAPAGGWRALVAAADAGVRGAAARRLAALGCRCAATGSGVEALAALTQERFDLAVLQRDLPGLEPAAAVRLARQRPGGRHLKVIFLAGRDRPGDLGEALAEGADDLLPAPCEPERLAARAGQLLQLKDAQDRAERQAEHLRATNRQLEESLLARDEDVRKAQDALLHAMARMAGSREGEAGGHLRRMQLYCRKLTERVRHFPRWEKVVDDAFLESLERCVPLHDIGKIGLPDHVLFKAGALSAEERALVEMHPLIGAEILGAIARDYGEGFAFFSTALGIVRSHHERWDGYGYPDRLSGEQIPPAARLVAVADVYDTLRRRRSYKPPASHLQAVRSILHGSPGQFDPDVLKAFEGCHTDFEHIYQSIET